MNPKVYDNFKKWTNHNYGKHGEVKYNRLKVHKYLGLTFDLTGKSKVKIKMDGYVERIINESPTKIIKSDTALNPAVNNIYGKGNSKKLKKGTEEFHNSVARIMFVANREKLDIHQTVVVLSTRVREPNKNDWKKLVRMIKYLNGKKKKYLTLSADDLKVIKWYVEKAFAVHHDFKSHTGAIMTLGQGAMQSVSRKQKLNTRSIAEAE